MTSLFAKKTVRLAIIGLLGCSVSAIAATPKNTVPYNPPGVILDLKKKNLSLVKTGSYLVNAIGNCNSCHVAPAAAPISNSVYAAGGDPFKDGKEIIDPLRFLGGGRKFGAAPAQVTANELTPDAAGNPGKLTLKQFITVMRTGKDPDDASKTIQTMPWPIYKNLTDHDLKAMYEYFRALPVTPAKP
ncbi:MAG: cytochrome C [Methylococcaceae bacterium]|nr:cytochrome C [Methylococcaceae bacterium]